MVDFPTDEGASTARMRPGVFVLVVHDAAVEGRGVWDGLYSEYIVREATTGFDALEWLSGSPLECIVCVLGETIRAEDFIHLVASISEEQAKKIVFVAPSGHADVPFLERTEGHWLAMPLRPEELITLVRAVSARR